MIKTTEKTWSTINKESWPHGAWKAEPDKIHWVDNNTGLDCLIVRSPTGALCGYVGVPDGHSCFDVGHGDVLASAHGGLTFSGQCMTDVPEGEGVCHPEEGAANKDVWWLGFDCAHSGDIIPNMDSHLAIDCLRMGDTYKDIGYVRQQASSLADQLHKIALLLNWL